MVDYKELYEIQLKYISSEKDAELVYKALDSLNKKLSRYDNNFNKKSNIISNSDSNNRLAHAVDDIFDHYSEYNALDKKEIQETLARIQKISRGNFVYVDSDDNDIQDNI